MALGPYGVLTAHLRPLCVAYRAAWAKGMRSRNSSGFAVNVASALVRTRLRMRTGIS